MIQSAILAAVSAASLAPWMPVATPPALAQAELDATVKFVTTGTNADVPLRSGNYTVFYPVARLKAGQVLAVINDEDPEWVEVAYPPGTPAVVFTQDAELRERDGKKYAVTTRRSSLSAFNIAASGRSDHYKRVFRSQALPSGTELRFIEAMSDPQTGEIFAYKIEAPLNATGFVARNNIRTASAADSQRYLASLGLSATQLTERLGLKGEPVAASTTDTAPVSATTPDATEFTDRVAESADSTTAELPVEGGSPDTTITMGELEGEGVISARLDAPPPAPKWDKIEAVKNLDASYDAISAEPLESAEFAPLIEEYNALLAEVPDEESTRSVRDYIKARVALLELRRDLQTTLSDLRALQSSQASVVSRLETASQMSLQGIEYSLRGRLERSTLYDGERLPLRYRLEVLGDQGVRTLLAYVEPPENQSLDTLIGKDVTVYAKDRIDPKRGFNVVHARQVQ